MLSVKNLTRKYKNGDSYIKAVNDITRDFNDGEMVFVLGASGSGKSTLLNVLCGLDTEIEGSVIVDGVDTSSFTKNILLPIFLKGILLFAFHVFIVDILIPKYSQISLAFKNLFFF